MEVKMNTKRQYKTYTREFKEEAVALVVEQGYSIREAANALGISSSLLYDWKKKAQEQGDSTVTADEKAELLKLRKEVKQLRMEKEILKKASAFFAKEMK